MDSILIADLPRYGDFVEMSLSNEDFLSFSNLTRFRSYLVSCIGDLKRESATLLDQVFPEYESTFSNIFEKTSKEILKTLSPPSDFENIRVKNFAKRKINQLSDKVKSGILQDFPMLQN